MMDYYTLYHHLAGIIAEKPADYRYTTDPDTLAMRGPGEDNGDCFYENLEGGPGCIIGHLIHKLNPEKRLVMLNGWGAVGAMRLAGIAIEYHSRAGMLANSIQLFQDKGNTWKDSLELAVVVVKEKYGIPMDGNV